MKQEPLDKDRQRTSEEILELALARGALAAGDFVLSTGARSPYYFDGRLISLDPEGAALISRAVLREVRDANAQAIGGPTLGADPIVAATVLLSQQEGTPIQGFLVRADTKTYGTRRQVEGPVEPGSRVAIVDDTCTSGSSIITAITAAEAIGCQVVKVIVILDRREGGGDELRGRGYDLLAFLEASPDGQVGLAREQKGDGGRGD